MEDIRDLIIESLKKTRSGPLLVNIVAKRTRQLQRGAKPLIEGAKGLSRMEIALREFVGDKIGYRKREK